MNINLNKVAKFFLICCLILGSILALGGGIRCVYGRSTSKDKALQLHSRLMQ